MSIQRIRDFVAASYNGDKWRDKVEQMPDNQVIAIYYSLQRREERRAV